MKFMVMCSLDPVAGIARDHRVEDGLVGLGFLPVGSSHSDDGMHFGVDGAFVGEFRARAAATLESMLREQISGLLGGKAPFRLCTIPMHPVLAMRRQA